MINHVWQLLYRSEHKQRDKIKHVKEKRDTQCKVSTVKCLICARTSTCPIVVHVMGPVLVVYTAYYRLNITILPFEYYEVHILYVSITTKVAVVLPRWTPRKELCNTGYFLFRICTTNQEGVHINKNNIR